MELVVAGAVIFIMFVVIAGYLITGKDDYEEDES